MCQYFSVTASVFHNISSEMLSFLHCWDCWWKCEFDADVKIENYNQHDGEQLLFKKKNLLFLIKSTYQKAEEKERYSCNLYIVAL